MSQQPVIKHEEAKDMSGVSRQLKELKERNRKTLTLPHSGLAVVIRKFDGEIFFAAGGAKLLRIAKANQGPAPDTTVIPDEDAIKHTKALIAAGVASPRVWIGEPHACPEEQITISEIAEDIPYLLDEINALNGVKSEVAAAAESFRAGTRGAAGSPSPEVSGAPDGDPPAVTGATDSAPRDLREGNAATEVAAAATRDEA